MHDDCQQERRAGVLQAPTVNRQVLWQQLHLPRKETDGRSVLSFQASLASHLRTKPSLSWSSPLLERPRKSRCMMIASRKDEPECSKLRLLTVKSSGNSYICHERRRTGGQFCLFRHHWHLTSARNRRFRGLLRYWSDQGKVDA